MRLVQGLHLVTSKCPRFWRLAAAPIQPERATAPWAVALGTFQVSLEDSS